MAIVKMKRLRLLAIRSSYEELLRELMLLGCVEVSEPDSFNQDQEITSLVKRETGQLSKYRSEQMKLTRAIKLLEKYAPEKQKFLSPRPETTLETLLDEGELEKIMLLAEKLESLDERVRQIAAEESRQRSLIASLKPWEAAELPLEGGGTERCAFITGTVPASADTIIMEEALLKAAPESQLFFISSDREQRYLQIICLREEQQDAIDALRCFGLSITALSGVSGNAIDNILNAEACIKELAAEKAPVEELIREEAEHREELKLCVDRMSTKIARAEAAERLMGTSSAVALLGWIPSPEEEKLAGLLEKYDCAWETSEPAFNEQAEIPIKVKNSRLTSPMSMVTEMYSLPAYNGIDANPLIFPFFTIFFGIMFADMGYGLLLLIGGLVLKLKAKPRGTMKHMSELLIICGISTFVFGFISGGFFGDAIPVVAGMFGHEVSLWFLVKPILNPIQQPLTVLIGSMILGGIQILAGMAINAYMLIRDGNWRDAIYDVGSWWLLFAGIALGVLGVTWNVCFAGIAALVLTQGRHKTTIIGKLTSGLASLYNVTGYFGDILSYSRIMALMLAGTVIASVVNTLGSLNGSIIAFAFIFLVGHAFNILLNLIGCFVHTSRLQYLEYFGKYYRDGGKPFKPLAINTKFVDIFKED